MAVKFANLASTTLSSAITNSATSIAVADASLFPTLGSGDYFYATIGEGSGSEIVKVTAISSNTLTVTRAQDGTTASAFSSGETIALRVVAAALDDIASQAQSAADTESVSIDGDTMTGNLSLGDNNKVILGAGNDLEIFSAGSTALIKAGNATSDIRIESDNRLVIADRGFNEAFAVFNDDSDVKLYNDGTQRLATTSTGIDVTGTISSGNLTISGASPKIFLSESDTTDLNTRLRNNSGKFQVQTVNDSDASPTTRLEINNSTGAVTLSGTLTSGAITTSGTLDFTANPAYIRNDQDNSGQIIISAKNSSGSAQQVRWDAGNASTGAWRPEVTGVSNLGLTNRVWGTLYVNNIRMGSGNGLLVDANRNITAGTISSGTHLISDSGYGNALFRMHQTVI